MKRGTGLRIACLGFVAAAIIGAAAPQKTAEKGAGDAAIKPFRVHFPDEALAELKRRIAATRWPDREIVTDQSQGVQLATIQKLARYWATDYNWRTVEAKLNALPAFTTRLMASTFTSFTCVRSFRTRCRSSSRTDGQARSSSS
jgi:Epoxide hydrolase N terminus